MAAIVCGVLIGWLVGRPKPSETVVAPPAVPTLAAASPIRSTPIIPKSKDDEDEDEEMIEEEIDFDDGPKTWDDELDDLILGDMEDIDRTRKMIELMSRVHPAAQKEIAEHLINFAMDDEYDDTARLLTNSSTDPEVLEVLFNDLMNRDNELMLPLMLEIARQQSHPMREEAKETLELFLDEDYGEDWPKWDEAMKEWLKENAF
jgi:hypothetical protein